jgi:hypothetical protein
MTFLTVQQRRKAHRRTAGAAYAAPTHCSGTSCLARPWGGRAAVQQLAVWPAFLLIVRGSSGSVHEGFEKDDRAAEGHGNDG